MAFEVTSNTIVKLLVRRGLESDRLQTVLSEGELAYTIDNRRVFVGDGITLGGNIVGNKHFGFTSTKTAYNQYAQPGDVINEINKNYVYMGGGSWQSINPIFYSEGGVTPSFQEASADNSLRVSPSFLGTGFALDYSTAPSSGQLLNTIQRQYGKLNLDARYISISADQAGRPSLYVGNIFNKSVTNNLSASLNVDNSFYLNSRDTNPYQIQFYANHPNYAGTSYVESISSNFVIKGKTSLGLLAGNYNLNTQPQIHIQNNGQILLTPNIPSQSYTVPGNRIYGINRIYNESFFDSDVTMYGNLSVFGDITYLETTISTTSALSVLNSNANVDTVVIEQKSPNTGQNILRVNGNVGGSPVPYLVVRDGDAAGNTPHVAVNYLPAPESLYTFAVSGGVGINTIGTTNGYDHFKVFSNNIILQAGAAGASDFVTVSGNIRASQDIIAYATSDITLKDNVKPISNALDKVKKLSGIQFTWKEGTANTGDDYGVVAQEVEKVMPEIVITRNNGKKAVRYDRLIPLLIETIKELDKKVEKHG